MQNMHKFKCKPESINYNAFKCMRLVVTSYAVYHAKYKLHYYTSLNTGEMQK